MIFSAYRTQRLSELLTEEWGELRIPDLQAVYDVAKPRSVLEIGCFRGVSTEFWLLHCARVVAIDPWPDPAHRRQFLQRCGAYPHLERVEGTSPDALWDFPKWSFDLAYIDGDHSYEAVLLDIQGCLPLIQSNGFIGGHDYDGAYTPGVRHAVEELLGTPAHVFSDMSWLISMQDVPEAAIRLGRPPPPPAPAVDSVEATS
jgi:hypothetical protein